MLSRIIILGAAVAMGFTTARAAETETVRVPQGRGSFIVMRVPASENAAYALTGASASREPVKYRVVVRPGIRGESRPELVAQSAR